MCGRFVSTTPPDQLAAYFGATRLDETVLEPSYNVAPTNEVYTVLERDGERRIETLRWGLVPSWAKDVKIGSRLINARAETVATKNSFRKAFARSRCIIAADSFYEWLQLPGHDKKTPMLITRVDGEPFAFAGLFEHWRDREVENAPWMSTCTIITGSPNARVNLIHDRMPVILPPSAWNEWLDRANNDTEALQTLLAPASGELMTFHPVSTAVNNPRSRGAGLADPIEVEGAPSPGDEIASGVAG
jgi:putative SOS response-associated peptidase YedK